MTFTGLWDEIADVGRHPASGGYRRFAWTDADLTLREWFVGAAQQRGLDVETDRNGNLWAWWWPPGWTGDPRNAFVTGSHLDSVPDGGAFDGPLGVVSAFAAVDQLRHSGFRPTVPVGIAAFSDEEGARFGVACVGSRLSSGVLTADRGLALKDADGTTLAEALAAAGRDPSTVGVDPTLTDRVGVFVELHVEQGRALDRLDRPLAVASSIWPHGRWRLTFTGEANHAGTTLMADRRDPMLAYAATVAAARARAVEHGAVATFGRLAVQPGGTNAIASRIDSWLDARAAGSDTLDRLTAAIVADAELAAVADGIGFGWAAESVTPIVEFPDGPRQRMTDILQTNGLGETPMLGTAAGHDAGILSAVVPTAMLFVRNPTGISHSPAEFAETADCLVGVDALAALIRDWEPR